MLQHPGLRYYRGPNCCSKFNLYSLFIRYRIRCPRNSRSLAPQPPDDIRNSAHLCESQEPVLDRFGAAAAVSFSSPRHANAQLSHTLLLYKYVGIISAYRCAFRYKIAANFCVGQSTVQNSQGNQCLQTRQFKKHSLNVR